MTDTAPDDASAVNELFTARDWMRYAVSAMIRGGLTFGHGTSTALDEAAFLILEALSLPIDDINPWLDCRLLKAERIAIDNLLTARIATRKPASYLTNSAYIAGRKFYVDERVIVPRSYIGELLAGDQLVSLIDDPERVNSVLDLCTGSGCLAILAAEAFPNALVDSCDVSHDALAVARRNVDDYDLGDRIRLFNGDLFAALPEGSRYDLIISNPPYVTSAAVKAFPPEYRAEPQIAHLGGMDGLDIVRRILSRAGEYLTPDGTLVVEIGDGRAALEQSLSDLPFLWLETETSAEEVFLLRAEDLTRS